MNELGEKNAGNREDPETWPARYREFFHELAILRGRLGELIVNAAGRDSRDFKPLRHRCEKIIDALQQRPKPEDEYAYNKVVASANAAAGLINDIERRRAHQLPDRAKLAKQRRSSDAEDTSSEARLLSRILFLESRLSKHKAGRKVSLRTIKQELEALSPPVALRRQMVKSAAAQRVVFAFDFLVKALDEEMIKRRR